MVVIMMDSHVNTTTTTRRCRMVPCKTTKEILLRVEVTSLDLRTWWCILLLLLPFILDRDSKDREREGESRRWAHTHTYILFLSHTRCCLMIDSVALWIDPSTREWVRAVQKTEDSWKGRYDITMLCLYHLKRKRKKKSPNWLHSPTQSEFESQWRSTYSIKRIVNISCCTYSRILSWSHSSSSLSGIIFSKFLVREFASDAAASMR